MNHHTARSRPGGRSARAMLSVLLGALGGPAALAQSFNVDIDTAGPPGAGVPATSFAAAAATPGEWRSVPATGPGPFSLVQLNGAPSGVTFSRSGAQAAFQAANANATGDYAKLLLDFQNLTPGGMTAVVTIAGLAPGDYEFYTYAIAPDIAGAHTLVSVAPSSDAEQSIGGVMPVNAFSVGVTHALHHVTVAGSTPAVTITMRGAASQQGTFNGLQIKQLRSGRLYVSPFGLAPTDGASWQTAFTDFQQALAALPALIASAPASGPPEVWIAAGTYRPSVPAGRSATFALVPGVLYYGGFAGTETSLAARNPALQPTILSGDLGAPGSAADNALHVVTASNFPAPLDVSATVLDGLTVRDGNANTGAGACGGGGLLVSSAALTLRGVTIRNNTTTCLGGGALVASGSARFEGCTFLANSAPGAGALQASSAAGVVDLYACRVLGNTASQDTGGVVIGAASGRLVNCVFSGNQATRDAAGASIAGSLRADIVNCTLANNTAGRFNGGVALGPGSTVANSIIWSNRDSQAGVPLWQRQVAGLATGQLNSCVLEGLDSSVGGIGNFGADPRLVNALGPDAIAGTLDDDLTVRRGSFAIDAGSNPLYGPRTAPLLGQDAAGLSRFMADPGSPDVGTGPSPTVDIGAYEFQGFSCRPDINGDGAATVQDIFDMLTLFFAKNPLADFNRSGAVTVQDLFEFLAAWFAGC